jgi:hypothetical protein
MNRRQFLGQSAGGIAALAVSSLPCSAEAKPETLYNGITLPSPWPPRLDVVPWDPVTPAYLTSPPSVIPIDLGRQLFVDDFLIETTNLKRTWHTPQPCADNPILKPDKPWEQTGKGAMAMVFSDGVWFDPGDKVFKMWYMGGYNQHTCHATSEDGIHWKKPELDIQKGTNIVHAGVRDSTTVWLDHEDGDPKRRYKLFRSLPEAGRWGLSVHVSPDGLHWSERILRTGPAGDRTTVFYNPFRKVWVYSLRNTQGPRARRYWETKDLLTAAPWERDEEPQWWTGADRLDPQRADLKVTPQLYNLDCAAYESLLVGLFTIWRGDLNIPPGRPKPNEICLGFSRDGFHWHRPQRQPFLAVSERKGDWNWGNVQSAGGCCLVVGDRLFIYHSGRAGTPEKGVTRDTAGCTGLAFLRRDGFASLDNGPARPGEPAVEGSLTTRPLRFTGQHLFVNVEAKTGELRVEVLDERGQTIPGFGRNDCVAVQADSTRQAVHWKTAELKSLAGKTVKLRFWLKDGRLYSFWVAREAGGASQGYVAAGGPGIPGATDK